MDTFFALLSPIGQGDGDSFVFFQSEDKLPLMSPESQYLSISSSQDSCPDDRPASFYWSCTAQLLLETPDSVRISICTAGFIGCPQKQQLCLEIESVCIWQSPSFFSSLVFNLDKCPPEARMCRAGCMPTRASTLLCQMPH